MVIYLAQERGKSNAPIPPPVETGGFLEAGIMKFCPKCGSPEMIHAVLGTTLPIYKCKICGYRGSIIVEDGLISEMLKEEYAKKRREKSK